MQQLILERVPDTAMNMEKVCGECKNEIGPGGKIVVCQGFCEDMNRFHIECVGLPDDLAAGCLYKKVMWMCECCRDLITNIKFRNIVHKLNSNDAPLNELDQLKQDVSRINNTLEELISAVKKESVSHSSKNPTTEPTTICDGSNGDVLTSTRIQRETPEHALINTTTFSLFVSNIAPDVTVEEVQELICEVLEVSEPVPIKRLVPAWRAPTEMEYVSFKVDLHQKYKSKALDASFWPCGVRCREFRNYSSSTWRPSMRSSSLVRTT